MKQIHFDYIVLGAGISGLAMALELQNRGQNVGVLERKTHPGGVLQSIRHPDFLWDRAAHTLAVDDELMHFFERYGIKELLVKPNEASKLRQIAIDGKIWEISNHPAKILGAKFLSRSAKLKLLREIFKRPIKLENPTVYEFFEYHFGKEITRNIISAVFAGIYAGDIERMEMKSVMAKVYEIEQESGSLIRGLIKNKSKLGGREIFGIQGGMDGLSIKLASQLKNIFYQCEVLNIQKQNDGFKLQLADAEFTCEHLISTLPAYSLISIASDMSSELNELLQKIEYEPMVLIHVGFSNFNDAPGTKAFGFLCGQFSSPVLKGAIYNSDLFEDRAPENGKSYTLFMKPKLDWLGDAAKMDQEILRTISLFRKLTKIKTEPIVVEKSVWEMAIPQLNRPYAVLKKALLEESGKIENFTLSGSYISGVSVPDCIKYNIGVAENLASS